MSLFPWSLIKAISEQDGANFSQLATDSHFYVVTEIKKSIPSYTKVSDLLHVIYSNLLSMWIHTWKNILF